MTTIYTVVGQHRTVPGLLLLLGNDNRYYAYSASRRPSRVTLTADWVLDADRESGVDKAPVAEAPDSAPAIPDRVTRRPFNRDAAGEVSRWRPIPALAIALILILVVLLASPAALAHGPGLATTTTTVTLHEAPGGDTPVLAELPAGTEIELTGAAERDFLEATFDGQLGWVRVDSLDGMIDTALVVLDASLRAAPNNDGAILGAVQAGSTVILTGAAVDGFLAASFDGTGGWLPANALA